MNPFTFYCDHPSAGYFERMYGDRLERLGLLEKLFVIDCLSRRLKSGQSLSRVIREADTTIAIDANLKNALITQLGNNGRADTIVFLQGVAMCLED
jgi:hypothetical protein